jgi:amidohydrolase
MTADSGFRWESMLALLDDEIEGAVSLRHELHANAQVGGEEHETAARVAAAIGVPDAPAVCEGRVLRIGPADGPAIAIRAELDALRGNETSGLPWAATNGFAHMCGHDIHMAAVTAVARMLAKAGPPVPLVVILQPREELAPGGAVDMMASTTLTDHDIRAVIGVHVQPRLMAGSFSASPGTVNASSDEFTIVVRGHAGHGAYPHISRDPIAAASQVVTALQFLVSRGTDPMLPTVITIGTIHGGESPNAIPETVTLTGTLRAFDAVDRFRLQGAIRRTAEQVAAVHSCSAEVELRVGEPPLVNDEVLSDIAGRWITRTGLVPGPALRTCGADDFSCYGERYPVLMVFYGVGTGSPDEPGLHHPSFAPVDEHVRGVAETLLAAYLAASEMVGGGQPRC